MYWLNTEQQLRHHGTFCFCLELHQWRIDRKHHHAWLIDYLAHHCALSSQELYQQRNTGISLKKVCHITTVHPAKDVRIFHKECCSLAAAGYEVTLVVVNGEDEHLNGVQIKGIKAPFKGRIDRIRRAPYVALEAALQVNADIYHFHDPEFLRVALKLKKAGKKVVYDVHEDVPRQILAKYWIPKPLRKLISVLFEQFENSVTAKLDQIVTATPFIRERFMQVNRNTIDINNFPEA
jgi:hypothetical protein